ncbi:MAG: MBL fold metallo-hydrolase [Candidatus Riflebacteria bacterium]|nr:MBL fold metallo-hydrolase [Candidatus Riflebacteria bacterium]
MKHISIPVGGMGNLSHLIGTEGGFGLAVDPAFEPEKVLKIAAENKIKIRYVFLTHHHFDHIRGTDIIKKRVGAEICAHSATKTLIAKEVSVDIEVKDGEEMQIGEQIKVKILHTPGHALGSICLVVNDTFLVTGDTLFFGNCGRTDLPGGNSRELFESLQKIKNLPDNLIILPGHDYGTKASSNLGEEKKSSAILKAATFSEFDALP